MGKLMAAAAIAAAAAVGACGTSNAQSGGPTVSRNFPVQGFERIEVAGPYDVEVRTGVAPSVQATGPERELERLVVEVRGDRLSIHPRKERRTFGFGWSKHEPVSLRVTVPNLRGAEIAGSGDIRINQVRGDQFEGHIAGSGDLSVDQLEVGRLMLGIAGSGVAQAREGRAREVRYEIAGSGDIDARGVASEQASVSIAGSGNVRAHATGTAKVEIAGSGDVEMSGGARCSVSKHGSGEVRCS